MPGNQHTLFLHRVFQYIGIISVFAVIGGGYWYWKNAQAGVTQQAASNRGLVGYWSFDEGTGTKAGDASGRGNTGTLTSGPTWTGGKLGKGISLDGVDDHIEIADNSSFTFGSEPLTVVSWVNFGSGTLGSYQFIISKSIDSFELNKSSTNQLRLEMKCGDDTPRRAQESTASLTEEGKWYHVAATFTPSTGAFVFYVNGVQKGTSYTDAQSPCTVKDSVYPLKIGSRYGGAMLKGLIDEVRIYGRALGTTEIANLYALGATTFQDTQSSRLTDGLVGYWPMNGPDISGTTAYDRSGQGNNGTLSNGPTGTIGRSGQGLGLDGVNDSFSAGDPANGSLDFGTGDFSYCAWIKTTDTAGQILGKGTWSFDAWGAYISAGKVRFEMKLESPPGTNYVADTAVVNDGNWHHVCASYDRDANLTAYSDGSASGTLSIATGSGYDIGNTSAFSIGSGGPGYLAGSVDEVRIYNRTLSAAEIRDLYQMDAPDKVNSASSQDTQPTDGLVGYWPMNGPDISGTTAYDRSGQGNNGTLVNDPTMTTGKVGQGLSLDGVNDYVSIANESPFRFTSDFSISMWVKVPSSLSSYKGITGKYDSIPSGWDLGVGSSGTTRMILRGTSGIDTGGVGPDLRNNSWHHLVLVNTPTSITTYVNRTAYGPTMGTWTATTNILPVRIGNRDVNGTTMFPGSVDEVRIYDRALTAAEVSALYYSGR